MSSACKTKGGRGRGVTEGDLKRTSIPKKSGGGNEAGGGSVPGLQSIVGSDGRNLPLMRGGKGSSTSPEEVWGTTHRKRDWGQEPRKSTPEVKGRSHYTQEKKRQLS